MVIVNLASGVNSRKKILIYESKEKEKEPKYGAGIDLVRRSFTRLTLE